MMVIFTSRSEKKALLATRKILDAFADRIGNDVWKTIITEDGLATVKSLLRKTATKNTAVACHWIRSRNHSDLVWIVGNRKQFNVAGIVPVNTTQKNIQHNEWENNWEYLPQIKALTAVAGLMHDFGKCSNTFQNKLKQASKQGDPLRHEWISCVLIKALVVHSGKPESDAGWLNLLAEWSFDEKEIIEISKKQNGKILGKLPPLAQIVAWLILSHHRLPSIRDAAIRKGYTGVVRDSFSSAIRELDEAWGYKNNADDSFEERLKGCFSFSGGLLKDSNLLAKKLQKWTKRLLAEEDKLLALRPEKSLRLILQFSRLCLMLGDHYISSLPEEALWKGNCKLYANTDRDHKKLRQKLDEHLIRVADQGLKISQVLPRFSEKMEKAYDIKSLKRKSPPAFAWQDKVVEKIKNFRQENKITESSGQGYFTVNMASTGCGKTIANAKIMQALSPDGEGLRYILALGLRTLTLQTGDEYRDKIGLGADELAVLIGSAAFKKLHDQDQKNVVESEEQEEKTGAESCEELLTGEMEYTEDPSEEFLAHFFPENNHSMAEKNKAFLYKPVLVCTIDHLIGATETTRGGKYILPFLRLMASDLVIDEVDDFGLQDLIAIGRLVHLAGMLGRNVTISSATIPPGLAEGFYNAYQEGWECYRSFYKKKQQPVCVFCDEFSAKVDQLQGSTTEVRCQSYAEKHKAFVNRRILKLKEQCVKRKGYIISCMAIRENKEADEAERQRLYFEKIKEEIFHLHEKHAWEDPVTGKQISFGVVRVAHVTPCMELSQYLMAADWDREVSPYIMAYHSRQVLLLRHEQERHLDAVLKRKEKPGEMPAALKNTRIRKCIDAAEGKHVVFILVATPVEEVGRDHDFDWAIIEPSSLRSVIQLAGRVLRHRQCSKDIDTPNIGILQYNLKGLLEKEDIVFCRPGYESKKHMLVTHDMTKLTEEKDLYKGIDAVPRIIEAAELKADEKLADLEHAVMHDFKDRSFSGAAVLQGWLTGYWWLTALHQQFNRFRESSPEIKLYLCWKNGTAVFCERGENGEFVKRDGVYQLSYAGNGDFSDRRIWLPRQYQKALEQQITQDDADDKQEYAEKMKHTSELFGEISILETALGNKKMSYIDQFGLVENR